MTWARRAIADDQLGPEVTAADQVVQPGDVIWVEPLDGRRRRRSRARM